MTPPRDTRLPLDDALLEQEATDIGWRLGGIAYEPGVPLPVLPLRAADRARTFVRRAANTLPPRQRARLGLAFLDGYVGGALQSAWVWALQRHDAAMMDEVRAFERDKGWLP
jgi:hypothetical protein